MIDEKEQIDIGLFEAKIQIQGKVGVKTELIDAQVLPDSKIEIQHINLISDVRIKVNLLHGQVYISFLSQPKIEAKVDLEISKLNIPLFGEDLWFPKLLSKYLIDNYNEKNPITFDFDVM